MNKLPGKDWKKLAGVFFKSKFVRHTAILTSGTAIAQVITVGTIPILSRIYSPENYGVLGLYFLITTVLGTIATFQYHNAVILAPDDDQARDALELCISLSLLTGVIAFLIFFLFRHTIASLFNEPSFANWILITPLSIFVNGVYVGLMAWANRHKEFKRMSINRVIAAFLVPVVSISVGLAVKGPLGLFMGILVSQLLPTILLWFHFVVKRGLRFRFRVELMKACARKYVQLPKFSLPAEFINNFVNNIPVFILSRFFGVIAVGHYNMSNRVLGMPIQLISTSVGEVFRQRATEQYNREGQCTGLFKKSFLVLALLSVLPFTVIILFGSDLFTFVLGNRWHEAGRYSAIMAPMFFLRFTVSPLTYLFFVAGKQREDFIMHLVMLAAISGTLWLTAHYTGGADTALMGYSAIYCIIYIYYLIRSYQFSKGS